MAENYTEYDLDEAIRLLAVKLNISGCTPGEGKSSKELFEEIEKQCPAAAEALLERTFEKDKLKNYLERSGYQVASCGYFLGDGDPEFEKRWQNLIDLYPAILEAIKNC